jgi:hypothetical protein
MIGQVLQLLGYTRNSMLLMGWEMVGLYLPSTILSLEHITLARQWRIVTKLQLWVLFSLYIMLYKLFVFLNYAPVCLINPSQLFLLGFRYIFEGSGWTWSNCSSLLQIPWNSKWDWSWYLGSIYWQLYSGTLTITYCIRIYIISLHIFSFTTF